MLCVHWIIYCGCCVLVEHLFAAVHFVSMITLFTGTSQKGLDPHLATFLTKRCVMC